MIFFKTLLICGALASCCHHLVCMEEANEHGFELDISSYVTETKIQELTIVRNKKFAKQKVSSKPYEQLNCTQLLVTHQKNLYGIHKSTIDNKNYLIDIKNNSTKTINPLFLLTNNENQENAPQVEKSGPEKKDNVPEDIVYINSKQKIVKNNKGSSSSASNSPIAQGGYVSDQKNKSFIVLGSAWPTIRIFDAQTLELVKTMKDTYLLEIGKGKTYFIGAEIQDRPFWRTIPLFQSPKKITLYKYTINQPDKKYFLSSPITITKENINLQNILPTVIVDGAEARLWHATNNKDIFCFLWEEDNEYKLLLLKNGKQKLIEQNKETLLHKKIDIKICDYNSDLNNESDNDNDNKRAFNESNTDFGYLSNNCDDPNNIINKTLVRKKKLVPIKDLFFFQNILFIVGSKTIVTVSQKSAHKDRTIVTFENLLFNKDKSKTVQQITAATHDNENIYITVLTNHTKNTAHTVSLITIDLKKYLDAKEKIENAEIAQLENLRL